VETFKKLLLDVVGVVTTVRGGDEYIQARVGKAFLSTRERKLLSEAGKVAVERGLALTAASEISYRVDYLRIALSVVGADLTDLDEKSLVICPLDKDRDVPGASSRLPWYRGIYANQEAGGTLFAQPVYTMLAIGADLQLNDDWVVGVTAEIGGVARVQAVDLTRDAIASLAEQHHALLFRGQGALVWGESPADAIRRAAALEYASQMAVLAHQSGLQAGGV